ncbi:transcriptional regulator, GntR family [Saccharopolyspora shandongensis]|uniref:Transcriptional regulator, GntR family n=1 Tax=Saccharopolyspora shandongensis TaxID=418495 RepID=A0A1H2TJ78_9PSEU|nr:GntR family transcriptional regulator [Saccharopolyspora shandongensis]SDW43827.1 transcriptional regulator, GntR family [Saccharopolyspora shandongensis]
MRARSPRLPDELAGRLREGIMTGRLRQGDHLHLERLAEQLGVSVTPVREALLALRGEGFVDLEPRRGFTVAPLSRQDFEDAHRLQATIAGELAARAARQIDTERLAELGALLEEIQMASQFALLDMGEPVARFHTVICRAAESPKLSWFLGIAVRYTPRNATADVPGWREIAVADHQNLLTALRHRDPTAARAAMHQHITHTGQLLIHHLQQLGLWSETPENPPPPGSSASHLEHGDGR